MKLKVASFFSGLGGFDKGLEDTGGFETTSFCEIDPYARAILADHWPDVPCHDDITKLKGSDLGPVDAIVGGFPCQDASLANADGKGTDGERTGLFREMCRLAGETRPRFMLMENVANLLNRGFGDVLRALAEIGFDAEWECISARDAGFDHERDRIWILAYPGSEGRQGLKPILGGVLVAAKSQLAEHRDEAARKRRSLVAGGRNGGESHGLSLAMERRRIHALGNALVPQIPEAIGREILSRLATTHPDPV